MILKKIFVGKLRKKKKIMQTNKKNILQSVREQQRSFYSSLLKFMQLNT